MSKFYFYHDVKEKGPSRLIKTFIFCRDITYAYKKNSCIINVRFVKKNLEMVKEMFVFSKACQGVPSEIICLHSAVYL